MIAPGPRGSALTILLLLLVAALVATTAFLARQNRVTLGELREEQAQAQTRLCEVSDRLEGIGRERTRWRIEALEGKDRVAELTEQVALLEASGADLGSTLARVASERDENISQRLMLARRLEDALSLLAAERIRPD